MHLGATTTPFRKKTLHKYAPGYYEQTVPEKDAIKYAPGDYGKTAPQKTLHKVAPGYYDQTAPPKDASEICTWLLRAHRSAKRHYTNMHLVTKSKPLHEKTLYKYAPGYYEKAAPRKDATQICTWLLQAHRSAKRHYTHMRLVTMRKPFHEKTLHKNAHGYYGQAAPQKDPTQICTWLL